MAFVNINKPSGLSPVKYWRGTKYDGKGHFYSILAADTNPYYVGDAVTLRSVVNAAASATNSDARGTPAVILSVAAGTILGAIIAITATPPGVATLQGGPYAMSNVMGNTNFRPTGAQPQNYYALVSDDPDIIYEIQEGGAGTNLNQTMVGGSAKIIYAAPATGVFVSGTQLDDTAAPSFAANQGLRILKLVPRIDNNFLTTPATGGAGQKWEVMIDNHPLMSRAVP